MKVHGLSMKTLLGCIPLLFLLGGCWDRTELNDLAIVTALAFDVAEGGQVRTTAQFIVPQNQPGGQGGGGGSGGSGSGKRTIVRSAEGEDAADALSKLQRLVPRRLFWGQCRVFIFSEAVSREGIRGHLDLLLRYPPIRERAYMYVSKGTAADALDLFPPIERTTSEVLRELNDLGIGLKITLQELSRMLAGDAQAAALPMVHILPEDKTADPFQTIPYVLGTAIFHKDRMIGEISERITRGVLWLRNEIGEYTVVFDMPGEEGTVSLRPVKANVRLVPSIAGDEWKITAKVKTEGDIVQNGTGLDPTDPKALAAMNEGFRDNVEARIRLALDETQQRLKADIFEFAETFHRRYPKQWEQVQDRWEQKYPEVVVEMEIETSITRPGSIRLLGGDQLEGDTR